MAETKTAAAHGSGKSDVHSMLIVVWGVGFTAVVAVMLIWLHSWFFVVRNDVVQDRVLSVQDPRLQELRAVETEELTTYGWVDEEQGVVRIPIDRAMDLLVKEAVPPPAPPAAAGQGEDE
jgi:hypothetical protein